MADTYLEYESDDEGLPFGPESEETKSETKVFKKEVCDCPLCKEAGRDGKIYEGEKSFYCSNARSEEPTCDFMLYKNNITKLIRRDITADEVKELCENGSFTATCTKISDDSKQYTGIFSLKDMGKYFGLKLSFPD